MATDLGAVTMERAAPGKADAVGQRAQQHWAFKDARGVLFAHAEVFEAPEQWGVRVHDRAAQLSDAELLKMVGQMLVWHAGCRSDTVDVVLGRSHEHHTLVRVGGEYV